MSIMLMTTLFYKALMLLTRINYLMLITLRGEGLKRLIQNLSWFRMKELCSKVFLIFPSLQMIIIMSKDMAFSHILYKYSQLGKSEEQLPQKTVGRLLVNSRPTVFRLQPFMKIFCQQSADCRPTVGSMLVICWPSVGWEPLSNTRKASARREEHCISTRNKTFSLESTILFRFFRDQLQQLLAAFFFLLY